MNDRTRPLLLTALSAAVLIGTAACGTSAPPVATGAFPAAPTVRLVTPAPAEAATRTSSAPSPTSTPTPAGSERPAAEDTVEQVAVAWLVAYRTASFDSAADAWIDRTAPYVTDQLAAQNDQLRAGGRGPGVAWQDFVDRRCTSRVVDAAAVVPPEAPRTSDTVHVQAAGVLRTSCGADGDPPDEALAVTLTAVHTDAGWRIARRDY